MRQKSNVDGTFEAVLPLLDVKPPARILEVGCFEGALTELLVEKGYQVTSCDVQAREQATTLPDFHVLDASQPFPFADGTFDAVVHTDVIEHLENPMSLMRETSRLLKDGGICILSTPNVTNFHSRIVYLLTGQLPLFRQFHFQSTWNHITPISISWIKWAGERFGMTTEKMIHEQAPLNWRRKLAGWAAYPFFAAACRSQPEATFAAATLVVRLRKGVH